MFARRTSRVREWALLGQLLKVMELPAALRFMDDAFADKRVPWSEIVESVLAGLTLSDAAATHMRSNLPKEVMNALRHGEDYGSVPSDLIDLWFTDEVKTPLKSESKMPVSVVLASKILVDAVSKGGTKIRLEFGGGTSVPVKALVKGSWESITDVSGSLGMTIARRFLLMVGIPYWVRDSRTGNSRLFCNGTDYELRVGWQPDHNLLVELRPESVKRAAHG